jgi:hypothetical protein
LSGGTDRIRATGLKHAIEKGDADSDFGLLTCKGTCRSRARRIAQTRAVTGSDHASGFLGAILSCKQDPNDDFRKSDGRVLLDSFDRLVIGSVRVAEI